MQVILELLEFIKWINRLQPFYTSEGTLFSLGRKPSNIFQEATIAFKKDTKFRLFDVKLPNSVTVTYRVQVSAKKDGTPIFGTSTTNVNLPMSEKKKIIELFKDKGYKVIKIEPQTMQVPEICPTCKKKGVPKIEKKNANDIRYRIQRNFNQKKGKKRLDEYWLVFVHNSRSKCRVSRFMPLPYPSWKTQKDSKFPYTKFMFPYNFGWVKSQLQ